MISKTKSEIEKYPYYGRINESKREEDYLSEKMCCETIRIRKKTVKKLKRLFAIIDLLCRLKSSLDPNQAIGLPIQVPTQLQPAILLSMNSESYIPKKAIITEVMSYSCESTSFTENEMSRIYDLAVQYESGSISRPELILELRGGFIDNCFEALIVIATIVAIIAQYRSNGLVLPQPAVPPHMKWLGRNGQPPQTFSNSGPKSVTVRTATQAENESLSSYEYADIMNDLENQSNKRVVKIQIGAEIYTIRNSDRQTANELQFVLAEKIYDSIRESDTDICDIASNLGFKADNSEKVKDHVFYKKHKLDRYGPDEIEYKRFDATLEQALAWKRLESGSHQPQDITWLKHEFAERHHEIKFESGYTEAHDRAQNYHEGYPWENT